MNTYENAMFKPKFVSSISLLLCACQGISTPEIRSEVPAVVQLTEKSLTNVALCFTDASEVENLGDGRLKTMTFPDSKTMEFSIGAIQMGSFKNFYLVTLDDLGSQRRVQIRRSENADGYRPISMRELRSIITRCIS